MTMSKGNATRRRTSRGAKKSGKKLKTLDDLLETMLIAFFDVKLNKWIIKEPTKGQEK